MHAVGSAKRTFGKLRRAVCHHRTDRLCRQRTELGLRRIAAFEAMLVVLCTKPIEPHHWMVWAMNLHAAKQPQETMF